MSATERKRNHERAICYFLRLGCGCREWLWCGDGLGEQQMPRLQIILTPPAKSWCHAQHCQLDHQLYPRRSQRQQTCGGLPGGTEAGVLSQDTESWLKLCWDIREADSNWRTRLFGTSAPGCMVCSRTHVIPLSQNSCTAGRRRRP